MKRLILLAGLALGCAHARSADCSTWALGKEAVAECYTTAEPASGEIVTLTTRDAIDHLVAADEPRVVTKRTEPSPAPNAQILQRAQGASISDTAGGVIRTMFNVTKAAAIGLFKILFAPGT